MQSSQSQEINIDLNRGHKEYDSKVKNIEGILSKIECILDVKKYKKEFNEILKEVESDTSLTNKMPFKSLQMDYEDYSYDKYSSRLDKLEKMLDEEVLPFYELYLLCQKIQNEIDKISGDNINEIILNTKRLITSLNKLNTHNKEEKNNIIDYAYKIIYSVIKYEVLFDRDDILKMIKNLNIPINIESIGRLLSDDLKSLDKSELIDMDLKHIDTDGLGYDYLDEEVIKKITSKTVGKTDSKYQKSKKKKIKKIKEEVNNLKEETEDSINELNNIRKLLKELKIKKTTLLINLLTRMVSLLMIPVITISAGHSIGKKSSEKIIEYKTITRSVDANSGRVVGEIEEIYDSKETTYVATVLEEGPWRENKNGGYVRNVTAYEYITPENVDDDFHASNFEIGSNLIEKYKYLEAKEELDEFDSTTESTILITETYQDKNDFRHSNKYVIPFTIIGGLSGIVIDLVLILIGLFGYEEAKKRLSSINNKIKNSTLKEEEIKKELEDLKNYALELQKEYNEVVRKYGSLGDELIIDELDTKDIKDFYKSLKI